MVSRGQLEADDVAQDALIRAIGALPRFRPVAGGLEAWLWTIVVNVARNHRRLAFRREALWEQLRSREKLADIPSADQPSLVEMTDEELIAAVRKLAARSRATIALRFGADLSFAEVGHQLGISKAAGRWPGSRTGDPAGNRAALEHRPEGRRRHAKHSDRGRARYHPHHRLAVA